MTQISFALVAGALVVVVARVVRRRRSGAADLLEPLTLLDVVAMMRVATSGGLTTGAALDLGLSVAGPVVAPEVAQRERGGPPEEVVASLSRRCVISMSLDGVVLSIRYGLPLEPALERAENELLSAAERLIERQLSELPVRLIFPLVVCFLPAFCLVGVVPLVVPSLTW